MHPLSPYSPSYVHPMPDMEQSRNLPQNAPSQATHTGARPAANRLDIFQKIVQLEGQRASLANMDGAVDRQIDNLKRQLPNNPVPGEDAGFRSNVPDPESTPAIASPSASQATRASSSTRKGKERMPPASTHGQASSVLSGQQPSVSTHLATPYSRSQLTEAIIRQNSPQDFSGAPLPSGASVRTPYTVFSHEGSAASTGVPGRSRTRPAQTARSEPYPAPSQSGASSSLGGSTRVADPRHPGQTISRGALTQRQQVPDPEHPGQTFHETR